MGPGDFNNIQTIVKEPWGKDAQWSQTQMVYQGYRGEKT
jgi:hypothetical protein